MLAIPQHYQSLDGVFQLADVARPIVAEQCLCDFGRQLRDITAILLPVALEEELGERDDVVPPFAKRRQRDRHHVEPVVKVLAEIPGLDLILERLVRGRDDTDVDADGFGITDAFEFALLQDPKQLDLELRGHARDFIQEDRPAVSGLESPGLVFDRAR